MASRFFSDLRDTQALAFSTGAQSPPGMGTSALVAIPGNGAGERAEGRSRAK